MAYFGKLESNQVKKMSINTKIILSPDNSNAKKIVQVSFWQKRPNSSKANWFVFQKIV